MIRQGSRDGVERRTFTMSHKRRGRNERRDRLVADERRDARLIGQCATARGGGKRLSTSTRGVDDGGSSHAFFEHRVARRSVCYYNV